MKLETERLILRKPKKSDWKDIFEAAKEKDVAKQTINIKHPYTKKDAKDFIEKSLKKWRKKEQVDYPFFIELKEEKKVIGVIEISGIENIHKFAQTGSWINKKYWRNGYITEAKVAVNDFAFNKLGLRRLESKVFKENLASNKTQEKMGYKKEGFLRKRVKSIATGKIHDEYVYGLLKEDWKKTRPKIVKKLKDKSKKKK